jgi:hypothetical protein
MADTAQSSGEAIGLDPHFHPQTVTHTHQYVRVEMTPSGIKWEIKARSPEQFREMFEQLKNEFHGLGLSFKEE